MRCGRVSSFATAPVADLFAKSKCDWRPFGGSLDTRVLVSHETEASRYGIPHSNAVVGNHRTRERDFYMSAGEKWTSKRRVSGVAGGPKLDRQKTGSIKHSHQSCVLWNTGEVYTVELYAQVRRAVVVDKMSEARGGQGVRAGSRDGGEDAALLRAARLPAATAAPAEAGRVGGSYRPDPGRRQGAWQKAASHRQADL